MHLSPIRAFAEAGDARGHLALTMKVVVGLARAERAAIASLAPSSAPQHLYTGVSAGKGRVLTANMVSVVAVGTLAEPLHSVLDLVGAASVLVPLAVAVRVARTRPPEGDAAWNWLHLPRVAQPGLVDAGVHPLLQAVQVGAHAGLEHLPVRQARPKHLQRGELLHVVVEARVRLVAAAVELQDVDRRDAGEAARELVPHREEALAVAVPREVEHDKEVGVRVLRRVKQVVELPGPHLWPEVEHVVPSAVRARPFLGPMRANVAVVGRRHDRRGPRCPRRESEQQQRDARREARFRGARHRCSPSPLAFPTHSFALVLLWVRRASGIGFRNRMP